MANTVQIAQAADTTATQEPAVKKIEPTVVPETAEEIVKEVSSGLQPVLKYLREGANSLADQFLSYEGLIQLGLVVGLGLLAWLISKPLRAIASNRLSERMGSRGFRYSAFNALVLLIFPAIWVVGLWVASAATGAMAMGNDLIRIFANLLLAWIIIRLFSSFVRDEFWSRTFAAVAWVIAALNILRMLNPAIQFLDSVAMNFGELRISLFLIVKGVILLVLFLWLASFITSFVQARLTSSTNLNNSVRTLIGQAVRIVLLFIAVMLALNAIGIDLTALAVFSGAVGVGIGFGLQAIFSNLMAGVIMLIERSIKVGDFVELESGVAGRVREINIRSTLITTTDNVDILVPNEQFISKEVTNWTLREGYRRIRVPFGVAYGTDKELVKKAALEAAEEVPHMLDETSGRGPQVWLVAFGASSLDFELVVWLKPEAVKRPGAVIADYNWALETALSKYEIEIPFPQRDLHIRSGQLPIEMTDK